MSAEQLHRPLPYWANDRQASIYRIYGPDDVLLYVGSSTNPARRLARHRTRAFAPFIQRVEIDPPVHVMEAMAAERELISTASPLFNVRHRSDQVREVRRAEAEQRGLEALAALTKAVA